MYRFWLLCIKHRITIHYIIKQTIIKYFNKPLSILRFNIFIHKHELYWQQKSKNNNQFLKTIELSAIGLNSLPTRHFPEKKTVPSKYYLKIQKYGNIMRI